MKEVDQLLEDAALVESVYDAQGKRHRKSRTHGRTQTPAEVALRLLILKLSVAALRPFSWFACDARRHDLFISQRHHGIDLHRAACGDVAGEQRDDG
jgi:hypothetical protein